MVHVMGMILVLANLRIMKYKVFVELALDGMLSFSRSKRSPPDTAIFFSTSPLS